MVSVIIKQSYVFSLTNCGLLTKNYGNYCVQKPLLDTRQPALNLLISKQGLSEVGNKSGDKNVNLVTTMKTSTVICVIFTHILSLNPKPHY